MLKALRSGKVEDYDSNHVCNLLSQRNGRNIFKHEASARDIRNHETFSRPDTTPIEINSHEQRFDAEFYEADSDDDNWDPQDFLRGNGNPFAGATPLPGTQRQVRSTTVLIPRRRLLLDPMVNRYLIPNRWYCLTRLL